jgi:hypothetical protein
MGVFGARFPGFHLAVGRVAVLVAAAPVVGCRTECAADEKATHAQIEREQKAMLRGQAICRELLSPRLSVVDERVILSASKENVLAQRSDVPASAVKVFAPLHDRLTSYRAHFKSVRADPFEPTLYVTLDPALEAVRATTLLATAAHAGYPRSRVYTKDLDLDVDWWLPAPEGQAERTVLCIHPRGDKGFALRFDGGATRIVESSSVDALGADVAVACAGRAPCADAIGVGERDGAAFGDVARVAAAALGSAPFKGGRPRLILLTKAPIEGSPRFAKRPCAY